MMKGVSPVVATVLLIAIAVVAAVAVWFWVGAMGRPAVPSQEVRTFIVENCIPGANASLTGQLRLYNNGALTINAVTGTAKLYDANLGLINGTLDVPIMTPGQRATMTSPAGGLTVGNTYYLEYPGIPLVKFGC